MGIQRLAGLGLIRGMIVAGLLGVAAASSRDLRADSPPKDEVPLTRDIIRTGQKLLVSTMSRGPLILSRGLISVNVEKLEINIASGRTDSVEFAKLQEQVRRNEERLKGETNPILRAQLEVAREALSLSKRQLELAESQNSMFRQMMRFDAEAVLRKPRYRFPDDELIVVVADFSCGNPDEGREIADEIAQNLAEMAGATGMRFHVLVGEGRPGVLVRSEQMARDVGKSFEPDTEYAVIWGTMSPRTVGKYRPHLTCCWKRSEDEGVSVGLDLAMEAEDLPLQGETQERTREAYRRLIGVTCAAIPNVNAAHAINREKTPDLRKYYEFLGKDSAEARALRAEVAMLTRWTAARDAWRSRSNREGPDRELRLRRTSGISVERPYPGTIYAERDESLLTLITEADGQAKIFVRKETGAKEIVYVDECEVTNNQFLVFLNSLSPSGGQRTNNPVGGVPWIELDEKMCDISKREDGLFELRYPGYGRNPVVMVSWFAARDYCRWAGKELPTQEEWEAAASPEIGSRYPWGDDPTKPAELSRWSSTQPGGLNLKDRSRIGCFDTQGNVREWCADAITPDKEERAIRGGGFKDTDLGEFDIKRRRSAPQISHAADVGFRGVIRLPVE